MKEGRRYVQWMKKGLLAFAVLAAALSSAAAFSEDIERAISLAAEQRYSEARAVLDPLLARDPDSPRARLLHGILYAHEGRLDQAAGVFDGLLRDHPHLPEPYNNLAVLYAVQDRYDEARETLLAAIERRPEFATAYANLGDVHMNLARHAYRRARELDPDGGAGLERSAGMETTEPIVAPPGTSIGAPAAPATRTEPRRVVTRPLELETAAAGAPGTAARPAFLCMRTGRFRDRRVAADAEQWLRARGAEVVVWGEERQEIRRHRVYLPPFASRAEAAAKVNEIRARGVTDIAILSSGHLKNGVSFGVYGVERNMRRRVAALERLGYPVRHAPDVETVHELVIEARAPSGPDLPDAEWASRFPGHPLRLAACG